MQHKELTASVFSYKFSNILINVTLFIQNYFLDSIVGLFGEHLLDKKWSFPFKDFIKDSVTFTEEILNGKLHFLCNRQY